MSAQSVDAELVAAVKVDLAAQPVHRLDWTCPLGCGQQWAVEVRLSGLGRAAQQLVRTVERHMTAGCGQRDE